VYFENDSLVADHLWFTMGKQFAALELKKGDTVAFNARVTMYEKGYRRNRNGEEIGEINGECVDYRLSYPTAFVKIAKAVE
jgi:hypothetical protein